MVAKERKVREDAVSEVQASVKREVCSAVHDLATQLREDVLAAIGAECNGALARQTSLLPAGIHLAGSEPDATKTSTGDCAYEACSTQTGGPEEASSESSCNESSTAGTPLSESARGEQPKEHVAIAEEAPMGNTVESKPTGPSRDVLKGASVVLSGGAASDCNGEAGVVKLHFALRCCHTRVGLHVRVVGDCPSLGAWEPRKGLSLHTSAMEFPLWRSAEPILLKANATVQYKYVICDNYGVAAEWEAEPNRCVHVASAEVQKAARADGSNVLLAETFNARGSANVDRFQPQPRFGPAPEGVPCNDARRDSYDFAPTIRGRSSCRSASRSVFSKGHSITNGSSPRSSCEGDGTTSDSGRLAREESFSNLFGNCGDECDTLGVVFHDTYALIGKGPLGEGTFGMVWTCTPRAPRDGPKELAAKIVRKAQLKPDDINNLIGPEGEVSTHLRLRHPHIVTLFEYFNEPHVVTLVLEYCSGGDLFDAITLEERRYGRGLPEPGAATVARHVLLALEYLQRDSIAHRDIKCENVLLSKVGVPHEHNVFKLCDFGFAARDRGDGLSDRLGSPDTVAPEILSGKRYGIAADLWSTGVVIYMAISAVAPFRARTDSLVMRRVVVGKYDFDDKVWSKCCPSAKAMVSALMQVDPSHRVTPRQALDSDWLLYIFPAPAL